MSGSGQASCAGSGKDRWWELPRPRTERLGGGACQGKDLEPGDQGVWTSFQELCGAEGGFGAGSGLLASGFRELQEPEGVDGRTGLGGRGVGNDQMCSQMPRAGRRGPMRGRGSSGDPGLASRPQARISGSMPHPHTPVASRYVWPPAQRFGNFPSPLPAGCRPVLPLRLQPPPAQGSPRPEPGPSWPARFSKPLSNLS